MGCDTFYTCHNKLVESEMLELNTRIIDFNEIGIAKLSKAMARKLALAVANFANKTDATEATVEDLLNYFPTRYEDRSKPSGACLSLCQLSVFCRITR